MPAALAVLSVLSAAFAVMALGVMLARRRISPFFALGIFALPAGITTTYGMTPEFLALALVTVGLLAWERQPRPHPNLAIAAFTLAALTREEMLLVPLALIVLGVFRSRLVPDRSAPWRLAIPFGAYAAWITFVRVRIGAWPFSARSQRLHAIPFSGLLDALRQSSSPGSIEVWLVVGALIVVCALVWGRRDVWYAATAAFALLALFLGPDVWKDPAQFGRALLPLFAYGSIIAGSAVYDRMTSERDPEAAAV